MGYTVDSFLEKINSISPSNAKKKNFESKKLVQRIYCNFRGNFGKYQILPFNSTISDFPFVSLLGTREINIPRKNIAADGSESLYNAWIRILPISGYTVKDPSSGREVSSLTAQEEQLLRHAYSVWDELYTELDGRNNAMDPTISKLIRRKNYTIFHGYCLNMYAEGEPRKPAKQNFSGLFILTAKNFLDIVNSNIVDMRIMNGGMNGNENWINDLYNRELSGRKGFMMLSVADNPAGSGFNISVSHQINEGFLTGVTIPEEEAAEMENPVESFLGWQARSDSDVPSNQRNLFNAKLISEAIEFMTDQLARIRMAKQNGTSVEEAIAETNKLVLEKQTPTDSRGKMTNDPVLAGMNQQKAEQLDQNMGTYGNTNIASNPSDVAAQVSMSDPYSNPAATHQDPVMGGNPMNFNSNGPTFRGNSSFNKPTFAGGNNDDAELPF